MKNTEEMTAKELKLYQAEQRIKKQRAALAEARRKRDCHVKCQIAGKLFGLFKIDDIALKLDSKEEADVFVNECFKIIDAAAKSEICTKFAPEVSSKIREAVLKQQQK